MSFLIVATQPVPDMYTGFGSGAADLQQSHLNSWIAGVHKQNANFSASEVGKQGGYNKTQQGCISGIASASRETQLTAAKSKILQAQDMRQTKYFQKAGA